MQFCSQHEQLHIRKRYSCHNLPADSHNDCHHRFLESNSIDDCFVVSRLVLFLSLYLWWMQRQIDRHHIINYCPSGFIGWQIYVNNDDDDDDTIKTRDTTATSWQTIFSWCCRLFRKRAEQHQQQSKREGNECIAVKTVTRQEMAADALLLLSFLLSLFPSSCFCCVTFLVIGERSFFTLFYIQVK